MAFSSSRVFGSRCRALMAAAKSTAAAAAAATSTKPRGRPTGITIPKPVSPALAEFLGTQQSSRTDALKGIWGYIKTRELQNPDNKKEIICDDKLKALFGKDKIGFLEIAKLLGAHFQKTG